MNCMLRSSSTRPLVRNWTMPSMTWHLCRSSVAASHFLFSVLCFEGLFFPDLPFYFSGSYVPSYHLTIQTVTIKNLLPFLLCSFLSLLSLLLILSLYSCKCDAKPHLPVNIAQKSAIHSDFCQETIRLLLWNVLLMYILLSASLFETRGEISFGLVRMNSFLLWLFKTHVWLQV